MQWRNGDLDPRRGFTLEQKFWQYATSGDPDMCWEWRGNYANKYGRVTVPSQSIGAHRLSYEIHKGPVPPGMLVMHSCDNPRCVNPNHLSAGTPKENMDDMWRKGRAKPTGVRGSAHKSSKMTADDVRFIRDNPQITHAELARRYGVDPNSIIQVRRRQTWKHIP